MIEQPKVEFRDITLRLDSGSEVTAPIGYWVAAIIRALPKKKQIEVIERVVNMLDHQIVSYTPKPMESGEIPNEVSVDANGKRHFTMHAQPGQYDFTGKDVK